jgi:hypothetical protein
MTPIHRTASASSNGKPHLRIRLSVDERSHGKSSSLSELRCPWRMISAGSGPFGNAHRRVPRSRLGHVASRPSARGISAKTWPGIRAAAMLMILRLVAFVGLALRFKDARGTSLRRQAPELECARSAKTRSRHRSMLHPEEDDCRHQCDWQNSVPSCACRRSCVSSPTGNGV